MVYWNLLQLTAVYNLVNTAPKTKQDGENIEFFALHQFVNVRILKKSYQMNVLITCVCTVRNINRKSQNNKNKCYKSVSSKLSIFANGVSKEGKKITTTAWWGLKSKIIKDQDRGLGLQNWWRSRADFLVLVEVSTEVTDVFLIVTFSTSSSNAHCTPSLVFALASMNSMWYFLANRKPSSRVTSRRSCQPTTNLSSINITINIRHSCSSTLIVTA